MDKSIFLILVMAFSFALPAAGQKKARDHDSTFYNSYRDKLTARTYLSRKYTALKLSPAGQVPVMVYKPNTTLNIGIGGTYRSLTINIGVGLNSFNPDEEKGKTHYLDLQSHFYGRKWNFDLLGEFYRGYFLSPKGLGSADGYSYDLRPDLSLQFGGIAVYRALNDRNFSYQAGLVQNEWQKKSAGSVLIGAETYYGAIRGDSALVPGSLDPLYKQSGINKLHFFEIGPGIGYGYTLVLKEHLFLLGSATINADFRFSREKGTGRDADHADVSPNFIFHAGTGYNAAGWGISIIWVDDQIHIKGGGSDYRYQVTTGNYRLIYAKRFALSRKAKKALKPVENLEKTK